MTWCCAGVLAWPALFAGLWLSEGRTADLASHQATSSQAPLVLLRTIELPNVDGRIDHLAADLVALRLYVAALGNNTVEVLDLKTGTHEKSLAGFREPQGIAVVAGASMVAVANGQGDGVRFIDASDHHPTRAVKLGDDSDNVRYDAALKRLFVGFGGGALAAISPSDGKVLGKRALPAIPSHFSSNARGLAYS